MQFKQYSVKFTPAMHSSSFKDIGGHATLPTPPFVTPLIGTQLTIDKEGSKLEITYKKLLRGDTCYREQQIKSCCFDLFDILDTFLFRRYQRSPALISYLLPNEATKLEEGCYG